MENVHIRFEYGEVLIGKKELLSFQLNLLEFLKNFKNYKNLRKRELILKSKLKKELASLRTETSMLQAHFPKEETEEIKIKSREKYKEKKYKESIETQLQEIKEKLAALG